MTKQELIQVSEIINTELSKTKFGFKIPPIKWEHLSVQDGYLTFLSQSNVNPFEHIFSKLATNRLYDYGQFTHFKSLSLALNIINSKSIQVSNLKSNQENDYAEFTEFLKRMEFYHHLLPNNYCQQILDRTLNPAIQSNADIDRENIFVLCFSQDCHNERFWTNYANNDTGVAINFKFKRFDDKYLANYNLRDVYYDNGYDFDFYTSINYQLKNKFNRILLPGSFVKFARFYKRKMYNWERETRLSFHYDPAFPFNLGSQFIKDFPINTDATSGRKYLNIPLMGNTNPNLYFDLDIVDVVCGKFVSKTDYDLVKAALNLNFPNATIWQRV